jgi:hypothetical protein
MASTSSSGGGVLSDESAAAAAMSECIGLLFGRWTALQLAVRNRWGGRDSQAKADQLASSVLSWFTRNAARGLYGGLHPSPSPSPSCCTALHCIALHYCCLLKLINLETKIVPSVLMNYD